MVVYLRSLYDSQGQKKTFQGNIGILIALLFALFPFGILYYFLKLKVATEDTPEYKAMIKKMKTNAKKKAPKIIKASKLKKYVDYIDETNKFSIKIPKKWKEEKGQITVAKFAAPDKFSKITVKIFEYYENQKKYNNFMLTLPDEKLNELNVLKREISLVENDDLPTYLITYKDENLGLKWTSISVIKKDKYKRYELNYVSKIQKFKKYQPEGEVVLNSFKFIWFFVKFDIIFNSVSMKVVKLFQHFVKNFQFENSFI